MNRIFRLRWAGLFFLLAIFPLGRASADEVILQYFNTSWAELTRRIPELAEAGYTALWLPPPFKAGGGLSVGFDSYDRFDLGSKNQNGSITTKYGTETELLNLIEVAHRFGLRVYFDNVMAHNGGPMSSGPPGTLQPNGFVPEDFHLRRTSETTYENYGWPNWSDEWQVLNRNPFGQDIAQEGPNNDSFGWSEGDDYPKWSGIRHANRPEIYLDTDLPIQAVNGGVTSMVYTFSNKEPFEDLNTNGIFDWTDTNSNSQHDAGEPSEPFTDTGIDPSRTDHWTTTWGYGNGRYDMGNVVAEDVGGMLNRAIRWFTDRASADGFRLDAVKHVPSYFFGERYASDKSSSSAGYCGQAQEQFNISRGFSDWGNHRDTVFNNVQARDDALMYGEHLGDPPWKMEYVYAGMRIANDDFLNAVKGNIGNNLAGMDGPSYAVISPQESMHYVMSHDNNYLWGGDREQAHAILLAREGLPIIYTDGYNQSGSPDWFPKPAEIPFLGQFGQNYIPNLLDINRHFGWGFQSSRWSAWDYVSFTRYDEEAGNNDRGVSMVFAMSKNYISGWPLAQGAAVFPEGARLFNYSIHNPGKEVKVQGGTLVNMDDSALYLAPNEYYAFSWRNPEMPLVWGEGLTEEIQPIMICENGVKAGSVTTTRKDGRNGDPAFNPYSLTDPDTSDYSYSLAIPRVTQSSNLAFIARADGSAENILMKLDGGIDLNSQLDIVTQQPGDRDNPPAISKDKFLGYEQMKYVQRVAEKFAAADTTRNTIGSPGAETYICTIGSAGFTTNAGGGPNLADNNRTLTWHFHNPSEDNQVSTNLQFSPPPLLAAGTSVTVWAKIGYAPDAEAAWFYYTTNGVDYPEGSAGKGKGNTYVLPLAFAANGSIDTNVYAYTSQWWKATMPAMPSGTILRYKIGACKSDAASLFPWTDNDIDVKHRMETLFQITNFNAATIPCYPHNDWGKMAVGLKEGVHVLRTTAILGRASGDTPIYRERTQTFYYDTQRPEGSIQYPPTDGLMLSGSVYGVKTRSDMSVEEVWYKIEDMDSSNDDTLTGVANGNNAWVKALKGLVPSPMPGHALEQQWEFNYTLIPTSGTATIKVQLRELTSSTNPSLSDVDGHFTTLIRTVDTGGNGVRLFVHEPAADSATVGVGSNLVAYFSKSLATGLNDTQLVENFIIARDGNAQSNSHYVVERDATAGEHAIRLALPNIFNGAPGDLHLISVTFTRDSYPTLVAQRQVYAVANDDSNDDGIPDSWEQQWGIPVGDLSASADDDFDGFSNLEEYIANTNPRGSNEFLMLNAPACPRDVVSLNFESKSNRNYFVWYTESLLPALSQWQLATPLTDPIEGTGQPNGFTDIFPNPTGRYYRVEVKIPSP
ncbi:MAG: alpha-amylase family glycosyl hydrolase [Lentisphaerota bacterium]